MLLAVGAWRTAVSDSESVDSSPAELARAAVAAMTGDDVTSLSAESLETDARGAYTIVVRGPATVRFEVVVAGDPLQVVAAQRTR